MSINIDVASVANFVLVILAWLFSNKRVDDAVTNLNKRVEDSREIIRAEMNAFRVEILAEFRTLNDKLDRQMKEHMAEYHK